VSGSPFSDYLERPRNDTRSLDGGGRSKQHRVAVEQNLRPAVTQFAFRRNRRGGQFSAPFPLTRLHLREDNPHRFGRASRSQDFALFKRLSSLSSAIGPQGTHRPRMSVAKGVLCDGIKHPRIPPDH